MTEFNVTRQGLNANGDLDAAMSGENHLFGGTFADARRMLIHLLVNAAAAIPRYGFVEQAADFVAAIANAPEQTGRVTSWTVDSVRWSITELPTAGNVGPGSAW